MSQEIRIDRQAGADAISARAIAIALAQGVQISECSWDIGTDLTHEHAHRLELVTAAKTVRVYFPDPELCTSGHPMRSKRTEERLQRAIAQLLPHIPQPTYAYR